MAVEDSDHYAVAALSPVQFRSPSSRTRTPNWAGLDFLAGRRSSCSMPQMSAQHPAGATECLRLGSHSVVYRRSGSLRAPASPLTVTRSGVTMGPSNTVQFPGSADQGHSRGKTGTAQLAAKPPFPEEMASRQCGRCRQFFSVEVSASPQAKWWACPACRRRLFGPE